MARPILKYALLALLFPGLLLADKRLRLKQADVLENITVNGESIQLLTGNVVFIKGNTILASDRARFNRQTEFGQLVGNIVVTKEDQTLTCDSLEVNSREDIFTGFGNVHVWDSTYNLVADTLYYFNQIDSGLAVGSVELTQKNQVVTAQRIEYIKATETDGVSYAARGAVTIREGDRIANSGEAIYDRNQGITTLRIRPKITENDQTIEGSEIRLHYQDEILKTLYIPAQAHALYPAKGWREARDTKSDSVIQKIAVEFMDDMTGSSLRGFFKEGKLDSMRLEGMATTLYHIFEDSVYQGRNEASGDTIVMNFTNSDLEHIFISGGSRGTYTPDTSASSIEGPIIYSSDDIDYHVQDEETDLHGDAKIDYTNVNLVAGFISVAWDTDLLKALPVSRRDSTYETRPPTIIEAGQEPMIGDSMIYNLKTKHGRVAKGKTKAEDGYYRGTEIRNRDQKIFYIENSAYTTCDLKEPHFHFESKRMKMIAEDKVIARPIILYIARIPVFGLPFGVFPNKKGRRHSGWIMPAYGESSLRGQYIDGLGYYWALNDYYDSKFTMSLADRQGITLRLNNQYRRRYAFTGSLFLESRQNFPSGLTRSQRDISHLMDNRKSDYVIRWNHQQELRNNQSLRVNARYYSSGDYNRRTGLNQQNRLNQQAVSNASYSKRWPKSSNSISINLSSNQDLMADKKIDPQSVFYQPPTHAGTQLNITNNTLPRMAFSHSQRDLIPTKARRRHWFNNIKYNYSSRFDNRLRTYYESEAYALNDTTSGFRWEQEGDGTGKVNTFSDYILSHSAGLTAPQKIFRYITVNPSLSLKSDWVNRSYQGYADSLGIIQKKEVSGFAARTTGSFSLALNTQIYGLFPLKIGSLQSVRHVLSPAISYSYTPDFSKPLFGRDLGYFEYVQMSDGSTELVDRFAGTMAGNTPRGERQSMNLSLNNVFQAKMLQGEKERKIDLFSWRLSTSRNFTAKEFQWSQLSSSIRANIYRKLNLDLSITHDFYEFDEKLGKRVDRIRTGSKGFLNPRLINARFSTGFRFSGERFNSQVTEEEADTTIITERLDGANLDQGLLPGVSSKTKGQLWSTSVSFSYSLNQANPLNPVKSFWMSTNSKIQLTEKWRIQYNARFDLLNKNLVSHSFSIYRDLHCWELSVNWTPNGYANGLYFRLNVKSPTLRDLKLEQRGGVYQRPFF